jgi:hypothetical protein
MISSYGMPRISAASRSYIRWKLVQQEPRPRERAASMRLQVAGAIVLQREACAGLRLSAAAGSTGPR